MTTLMEEASGHRLKPAIRAAVEVAGLHGAEVDRCEILQDGHTLVLRLSETLVARVVTEQDGPRQGPEWFTREIGVARFLAEQGAPVIPVHPTVPPGPHEHLGYTLNFWRFVTRTQEPADPESIGRTLFDCHTALRNLPLQLPELAIIRESRDLLETLRLKGLFPPETLELLGWHLGKSLETLAGHPFQALHGDSHEGNAMPTTEGLLWTDWEDAFSGPVEWDLASLVWNSKVLDGDEETAGRLLDGYRRAGGAVDDALLEICLTARAAVMCAWYPILYRMTDPDRRRKLSFRLDWLEHRRLVMKSAENPPSRLT